MPPTTAADAWATRHSGCAPHRLWEQRRGRLGHPGQRRDSAPAIGRCHTGRWCAGGQRDLARYLGGGADGVSSSNWMPKSPSRGGVGEYPAISRYVVSHGACTGLACQPA